MSSTHLAFLIFVAVVIVAGSLALDEYKLNEEMVLSRADAWRLGFGPVTVVLGVLLGIAAVFAYRGSVTALQLCASWAAIYSVTLGGLAVWHFPQALAEVVLVMLVWSTAWYLWIRRWRIDHGE